MVRLRCRHCIVLGDVRRGAGNDVCLTATLGFGFVYERLSVSLSVGLAPAAAELGMIQRRRQKDGAAEAARLSCTYQVRQRFFRSNIKLTRQCIRTEHQSARNCFTSTSVLYNSAAADAVAS